MRWNPPSERVQFWLVSPLLVFIVPFVAVLVAVIWLDEQKARLIGPDMKSWRPWFAWYPVRLGSMFDSEHRWCWLEMVERKRRNIDTIEYRERPR
jgi:hypothetical protein